MQLDCRIQTSLIDSIKSSTKEWAEYFEVPARAVTHDTQLILEQRSIVQEPADMRTLDWLASQEYPTKTFTYEDALRPQSLKKQLYRPASDPLQKQCAVFHLWAA